MKLMNYLKDKIIFIISFLIVLILIILLLISFNVNKNITILTIIIYILFLVPPFILDYININRFYKKFNNTLNKLDKKYLIHEIIKKGVNTETNNLLDYLYEINKDYIEDINIYKNSINSFKDYLQLWCHEIKTPIATSKLIITNNKKNSLESISEELNNIEYYVEQVLYYSKSENVENDYLITKINLKDVINNVIKNNKKDILSNNIRINTFKDNIIVESDSKWISYIINQITINSIKYISNNPVITFDYKLNKNNTILTILDNGIGINKSDIDRVFDKGFTGLNGRIKTKSTGMGLFLAKKLCNKLGIDIQIESVINKYTKVTITFPLNNNFNLTNM